MPTPAIDWNDVVKMNPRGYVEFNNGKEVLHGPINEIIIDDADMVEISMKWCARMSLDHGIPSGKWEAVFSTPSMGAFFPNLIVPYVVEDTLEKGQRIRFNSTNIIYLDDVKGLDPADVEGLILPS